ncbi:N-acetyltransferase [Bacillus sp. JCM 19041]|uniref:GNAT family N-acetyltransferase n=1 Tax=Bacillus sp. JCM 19041 TaxID=1460637 RepID=UPI0006D0D9F7
MYTYSSLENTSDEVLFQAFKDAFEDYPVTVHATLKSFQHMLQRRGYDPRISLGAFKKSDHALAGFVLNGYRMFGTKRTAYDIVTGTVPSHRRQGITNTILEELKEVLKQKQAEQYVTEVLKVNPIAFEAYKKQGFEIRREFSCYQLKNEN